MFCGVLVLRRIATANLPAFKAQAQMNPCISSLDTFLAHMFVGRGDFDLI
jgi:hypothetical protein